MRVIQIKSHILRNFLTATSKFDCISGALGGLRFQNFLGEDAPWTLLVNSCLLHYLAPPPLPQMVPPQSLVKWRLNLHVRTGGWIWATFRAFFNYITTEAFTPVSPLLTPVVKHDFQMNWALLIISKRLTLLKMLHLPAFSYPLTFSTLIPSYKSRHRQGWC